MSDINIINIGNEARVDSREIAEWLGNQHQNTYELIKDYPEDFREFGIVRFETEKTGKRGRPAKYALLNEDQCYLLLSYSDNTPEARKLKIALVKAFKRAREEANLSSMLGYFLLDQADSWEKRFVDGFYSALGKMAGLPFNGHKGGTPPLFAQITRDWVYRAALEEEVYQDAKKRCRRGEKIHQWLTPQALRRVENQLISITALANGCVDYQDFIARCTRAYGRPGQMRLIYPAA